jgi:hypothetical protein
VSLNSRLLELSGLRIGGTLSFELLLINDIMLDREIQVIVAYTTLQSVFFGSSRDQGFGFHSPLSGHHRK